MASFWAGLFCFLKAFVFNLHIFFSGFPELIGLDRNHSLKKRSFSTRAGWLRHEPFGKVDMESKMAGTRPIEYLRQVRSELKKVTWPSRKETTVSTIAVFIMVSFAAIFLFVADQVMALLVRLLLGLGG